MTKVRERLWTSVGLAVVFHAVAFVLLQLFLVLRSERLPEYTGPMFVQLEEQPVIQQSREPAPVAVESRAAAAESRAPAAEVTPSAAAAPAAQPLRPTASSADPQAPPKPSGSPFRMEGSAAQETQAPSKGPLRPAGEGFQAVSEQPTLPPAGVKSQGAPLKAEAVTPVQSGGQALPLESVDRALAGGRRAGAAGAAAAGENRPARRPAPGGRQAGERQRGRFREGISIACEDPAQGREPSFMPKPVIPAWVSEAGLTLTVEVLFRAYSSGGHAECAGGKSSGYSDVDTSVLRRCGVEVQARVRPAGNVKAGQLPDPAAMIRPPQSAFSRPDPAAGATSVALERPQLPARARSGSKLRSSADHRLGPFLDRAEHPRARPGQDGGAQGAGLADARRARRAGPGCRRTAAPRRRTCCRRPRPGSRGCRCRRAGSRSVHSLRSNTAPCRMPWRMSPRRVPSVRPAITPRSPR